MRLTGGPGKAGCKYAFLLWLIVYLCCADVFVCMYVCLRASLCACVQRLSDGVAPFLFLAPVLLPHPRLSPYSPPFPHAPFPSPSPRPCADIFSLRQQLKFIIGSISSVKDYLLK